LVGVGLVLLSGLFIISDFSGEGALLLRLAFFLGCAFRLGLPSQRPYKITQGLGALFDLTPAIMVLVLLIRMTPAVMVDAPFQDSYAILVLIAGLIAGLRWAVSEKLEAAHPFWIFGFASIATFAILRGQPQSGIIWGLGLVYGGGLLFLYRRLVPWQIVIPAIGLWAVSALPFSPLSAGYQIYQEPVPIYLYLLLLLHGLLLVGFIKHTLRVGLGAQDEERWVLLIFPAGLGVLLVAYVFEAIIPWQGLAFLQQGPLWPGLLASILGVFFWWVLGRFDLGSQIRKAFRNLNDLLDLILGPLVSLVNWVARLMSYLSLILEGQGGILWALLLIVLILSLILEADLRGFPIGN